MKHSNQRQQKNNKLRCYNLYLWDPVDAHDKKQLKKNPEVSHLTFAKLVFLPDPTGKLENCQEVEDSIDTQENQYDHVEIEKPWQVLSNHAGNANTEEQNQIIKNKISIHKTATFENLKN